MAEQPSLPVENVQSLLKELETLTQPKEKTEKAPEKSTADSNATNNSSNPAYEAWAAGTGFGHDLDQSDWDLSTWKTQRLANDDKIVTIVEKLTKLVEKKVSKNDSEILGNSNVLTLISGYLDNDSLADMVEHRKLYLALFAFLNAVCKHDQLLNLVASCTIPQLLSDMCSNASTASLFSKKGDKEESTTDAMIKTILETSEAVQTALSKIESEEKEDSQSQGAVSTEEEETDSKEALAAEYVKAMTKLRFAVVEDDEDFAKKHKYKNENQTINKALVSRLSCEYADLSKSLPVNVDSSIFLRVDESKMALAKMLIIPRFDTPYGGGCFLFDIYFGGNYPSSPPKVSFLTTGKGSVYFNPNLYACGKVCLSLLGTWQAAVQGESWNAGVSTFLQVAISLQSLVFVEKPYFNEPGYEQEMHTESGQQESDNYDDNIQKQTVRWAMIDVLKNPPKVWEDVIKTHFKLQKDRCLAKAKEWCGEKNKLVTDLQAELDKL